MGKSQSCYCAFCKHERKVYLKKHISFVNVLLSILVAFLLMFVFWQELDARVVILFVASICFAEMFILFRWRLTLPCPYCGFDPVLYKKSASQCAEKVKLHMGQRNQNPATYLHAKNPFQHLKPIMIKNHNQRRSINIKDSASEAVAPLDLQSKKQPPALQGE